MWVRLAVWLRAIADVCDPPPNPQESPYLALARLLVVEADKRLGQGFGEAKRHQVYAALIKTFPSASKRELARVIEDALDSLRPSKE